ncbi:methylcytosine dioxygenase TET2-like protein [Labeo rohita]|uniref:Methylcytosine dioxygenase TET n=1 Tax=Labeo rohita TaxID=84645 RepID=A0A498NC24_LABRO|nr:methylcytosine dioxygenase TET2-like protein [Labeo rohita]
MRQGRREGSLVNGPRADQMETEKTSHETEKSLLLSQISATQQTDPLLTKRQNGDQSQQFNGDTNWSHFKPSTVVYPMKSQQENCSGPANTQGIFDQSMYEMNGQMKHALSEQTFLDFHQPKKLCTDSEVNGNEDLMLWDKRDAGMEKRLEGFPKHNKPGNFEIKHSKRNGNFPNGDLFSLSRNKQVPMPNGATTSPPSVKGTTGDLLEKTLSQYYPEHVSIAPQTNSSQVDQVTSNLPEQETPSPSLTSGFPISPQTSASEPLAKAPPEVQGSNGYNPEFTVNGYSKFVVEHKKPTYPLSDLPDMETQLLSQAASESNVPPLAGINGCSQIQKDREGLQNDSECLSKSKQDFSHESYILPPVMAGAPSQNTQTGAQGDLQRHAALRMHLLQRQQSPNNIRPSMPIIKSENCSSLETSAQLPPIEVQRQDQDKAKVMPVVVKQEHPSSSCEQSQQRSILATMEQQLKQYQLSPVFERKSMVIKSPNKVKVEMAGAVTVLSTSAEGNAKEQCKPQHFTPPKMIEPGLQSFLESPMKMLDTPIKNLLDTPLKTQYDISPCHCVEQISERDEGPYYTHLGSAPTVAGIRKIMEERRTCACQGFEPDACGASFSFGCSWSMYYNGCKFARSKIPRKFKLLGDDPKEEEKLEQNLQGLATLIAPTYKKMAPDAYSNQVEHEHRAPDCRLGQKEGRPFSGVTACLDFCAHAHRDLHNMQGGSTVVCTLTREDNREIGKIPEDEQLHVLPLYKASSTDEFGSAEAQLEKTKTGAIQVLSAFRRQVRMLPEPAKSCRQKKLDAKRAAANKPNNPNTPNSKMDNTQQAKQKQAAYENPGQNTTVTGPGNVRTNLDSGHFPLAHGVHQPQQPHQQHAQSSPNPSYTVPPFSRFSNPSGTFSNTSKSATPHPQTPSSAGPYPSPLHAPHSYMNASNAPTPYPRSLTPNPLYPGYQCNGGLPMDNYHPYYSSNLKHPDMYHPQRNSLYSEQQYNAPQHYGVNYPPHYGEPSLPANGYGPCNMKPGMHSMGHYPGYAPNMPPDAFSRPPSAHLHLDYAAIGKSSQFEAYPKPRMSQNPQMFPPNLNSLSMQSNKDLEINMRGANGISQVFPPLGTECFNPNQPPGLRLPNENALNPIVKQEPLTQTSEQKEKEDVWSDSEHNFLDPEIGGVAVAPSHGSIIIECAKRELHATTPLKKPDRNHPTRISLVFYQHKNLNEAKHGLALWEAKMAEKAREKEEDAEKHGAENTSSKSSGKKVKREHSEPSEPSETPYKQFLLMLTERSSSCTTNTYVSTSPYAFTKVTGPYNQFL